MGNWILIVPLLFFYTLLSLWCTLASPFSNLPSQDLADATHSQNRQQFGHLADEIHCSRERSRAAWKVVDEYLMPFVEKENYQISRKCKLHPENDMFRDQELHKLHHDVNDWKCGYCKKSFYAEKYLDKHFDNRHYNLLNNSKGNCLADLCGALHCDLVMDSQSRKTKCNPAAAMKNRHLCEKVADNCFPVSGGPSASRLHGIGLFVILPVLHLRAEFFLRQFCDAHSCSGGLKPFSRGGKRHTSTFYIVISVLILMLLPLFYGFVYMYQRGLKTSTQDLRRVSQNRLKKKPS